MITHIRYKHTTFTYRVFSAFIAFTFVFSTIIPPQRAYSQSVPASPLSGLNLPQPGVMVTTSPAFIPPVLKGLIINPEQPFQFDFVFDSGDSTLTEDEVKQESTKLIKYFLASLTMPEDELWVNLSPYEEDRIIPNEFGKTEMGRDLLAQDYLLKQLTASLIYPEDELGKKFWDRVYEKAHRLYGTSEIPVNTFNKVWIIPDKALIYENGDRAFIVETHMKVMLEEDYVAMDFQQKSTATSRAPARDLALEQNSLEGSNIEKLNEVSSSIIREIIIPEIEKEINTGKNFAKLRQIYHSFILAAWYKKNLHQSILSQKYADQKKMVGLETADGDVKDKIYQQYLNAFEKGVYDFIKEDYNEGTQEPIPRKYFSGGVVVSSSPIETQQVRRPEFGNNRYRISANFHDPTIPTAAASSPGSSSESSSPIASELSMTEKVNIFTIVVNGLFQQLSEIEKFDTKENYWLDIANLLSSMEDLLWDDSDWEDRGAPVEWLEVVKNNLEGYLNVDAMQTGGLKRIFLQSQKNFEEETTQGRLVLGWIDLIENNIHSLVGTRIAQLRPKLVLIKSAVDGKEKDRGKVSKAISNSIKELRRLQSIFSLFPYLRAFTIEQDTRVLDFSGSFEKTLEQVYFYGEKSADGGANLKRLLGKKGANLAEMTRLGLPVPPGYTIPLGSSDRLKTFEVTNERKRKFITAVGEIENRFETMTGNNRRLGDSENPLLLSVRAGAEESSPGKYLTITRVGLHTTTVEGYGKQIGNLHRAYYDYIRFIVNNGDLLVDDANSTRRQMTEIVSDTALGKQILSGDFTIEQTDDNLRLLTALSRKLEAEFEQQKGVSFPKPEEQIIGAIEAVVRDYNSKLGSGHYSTSRLNYAVNVQAFVYGAIDDSKSLSGVVFSRNPFNGRREPYGEVRFNADGEEIVTPYKIDLLDFADRSGSLSKWRRPKNLEELKTRLPGVYSELSRAAALLDEHFTEIQDIEFTVENGKLYFLQTRGNERYTTPLAKARILIDMVTEGRIEEKQALERIRLTDLMWLQKYFEAPVIRDEAKGKMLGEGIPLIPGIKAGPAVIGAHRAKPGSIVFDIYIIEVAKQVVDFDRVVHEINGVVTMQGNLSDHAAVSIRGTGVTIPYVTAIEDLIVPIEDYIDGTDIIRFGGQQVKAGEVITIDGNTGRIYRELDKEDFISSEVKRVLDGELSPEQSTLYPYYAKVIEWIEKLNDDGSDDKGENPMEVLPNGVSSPIGRDTVSSLTLDIQNFGDIDFNFTTEASSPIDEAVEIPENRSRHSQMKLRSTDYANLGLKNPKGEWTLERVFPHFQEAPEKVKKMLIDRITHPKRSKGEIESFKKPLTTMLEWAERKVPGDKEKAVEELTKLSGLIGIFDELAYDQVEGTRNLEGSFYYELKRLREAHYVSRYWGKLIPHDRIYPEATIALMRIAQFINILQELDKTLPDEEGFSRWKKLIRKTLEHPELRPIHERKNFMKAAVDYDNPYVFVDEEVWHSEGARYVSRDGSSRKGKQRSKKGSGDKHPFARQFPNGIMNNVLAEMDYYLRLAMTALDVDFSYAEHAQDTGTIKLESFRNPLLKDKEVVPISVNMSKENNAFLLSGPNMGGKTVSARTIFLAVLLNQSGLPLPAISSELSIFNNIYSIFPREEQLQEGHGYFGSILKELVELTENAGEGDLVIIDEVPTGTDYYELVAITTILVEDLIKRGATVIVTGHLKKAFELIAQRTRQTPYMQTANEEGEPDFGIAEGIAKRSFGIELSREAGFPSEVTELALAYYSAIMEGATAESLPDLILEDKKDEDGPSQAGPTETDIVTSIFQRVYSDDLFAFSKTQEKIVKYILSSVSYVEEQKEDAEEAREARSEDGKSEKEGDILDAISKDSPLRSDDPEDRLRLTAMFLSQGVSYLEESTGLLLEAKELDKERYSGWGGSEYDHKKSMDKLHKFEVVVRKIIKHLEKLKGEEFVDGNIKSLGKLLEGSEKITKLFADEKGRGFDSEQSSDKLFERLESLKDTSHFSKHFYAFVKDLEERRKELESTKKDRKERVLDKKAMQSLHSAWRVAWKGLFHNATRKFSPIDEITGTSRAVIKHGLQSPEYTEDMHTFELREAKPYSTRTGLLGNFGLPPFIEGGVPQTLVIDSQKPIQVLTGPNSSGKTAIMLTAYVDALASHHGFYTSGRVKTSHFDNTFAFFGGSNVTWSGESYFRDILERYANMLKNVTSNSFVILDEMHGTDNFELAAIQLAVLHYLRQKNVTVLYNTHIRDGLKLAADKIGLDLWKTDVSFNEDTFEVKPKYTVSPDPELEAKSYGLAIAKQWLTENQYRRAVQIYEELINEVDDGDRESGDHGSTDPTEDLSRGASSPIDESDKVARVLEILESFKSKNQIKYLKFQQLLDQNTKRGRFFVTSFINIYEFGSSKHQRILEIFLQYIFNNSAPLEHTVHIFEHSMSVALFYIYIGNALGLDAQSIENGVTASLIHDLGKFYSDKSIASHNSGLLLEEMSQEEQRLTLDHEDLAFELLEPHGIRVSQEVRAMVQNSSTQKINEAHGSLNTAILFLADQFDARLDLHRNYQVERLRREGLLKPGLSTKQLITIRYRDINEDPKFAIGGAIVKPYELLGTLIDQNDPTIYALASRTHDMLDEYGASSPIDRGVAVDGKPSPAYVPLNDSDLENLGLKTDDYWLIDRLFSKFQSVSPETRNFLIKKIKKPKRLKKEIEYQRALLNDLIESVSGKEQTDSVERLNEIIQLTERFSKVRQQLRQRLSFLRLNHYPDWKSHGEGHTVTKPKPYSEVTRSLIHIGELVVTLQRLHKLLPESKSHHIQRWRTKIEDTLNRPELKPFVDRKAFLEVVDEYPGPFLFVNDEQLDTIIEATGGWEEEEDRGLFSGDRFNIWEVREKTGFVIHRGEDEFVRNARNKRYQLRAQGRLEVIEREYAELVGQFTQEGSELWRLVEPAQNDEDELSGSPTPTNYGTRYYQHDYLRQFANGLMQGPLAELDFNARMALMMLEEGFIFADLNQAEGEIRVKGYRNPLLLNDRRVKKIEPISIELDDVNNALLLSGPNMGGKTTTARAIGLAVLLTQAGLPLPAELAELSIFQNIHTIFPSAEQIQLGYGYYEMLVKRLAELTKEAGPGDLIILDEVPTGTEYKELVSVAVVLIEDLIKTGATVVVTGHLKKAFELIAQRTGQQPYMHTVKEEDGEMVPDFQLTKGIAKRSYGIELTHKAEFPDEVTELAKTYYQMITDGLDPEEISKITLSPWKKKEPKKNEEREDPPFDPYLIRDAITNIYHESFFAFNNQFEFYGSTQDKIVKMLTELKGFLEAKAALSKSVTDKDTDSATMNHQLRLQVTKAFMAKGNAYLEGLTKLLVEFKFLKLDRNTDYRQKDALSKIASLKDYLTKILSYLQALSDDSYVGERIESIESIIKKLDELNEKYKDKSEDGLAIKDYNELNTNWLYEWRTVSQSSTTELTLLDEFTGIARAVIHHKLKSPRTSDQKHTFALENSKPFVDENRNLKDEDEDDRDYFSRSRSEPPEPSDPFVTDPVEQSFRVDPENPTLIFTGPNSSGKTVAMFNALINAVFALNGFYVSGDMEMSRYDQVFAIFGGENVTLYGESYFFNIIKQYAQILKKATPDSLIILDELHGTDNFEMAAIQLAVLHYLHNLGATVLYNTHIRDGLKEASQKLGLDIWKTNVTFDYEEAKVEYEYTLSPDPHLEAESYGLAVAKKWLTEDQYTRALEIHKGLSDEGDDDRGPDDNGPSGASSPIDSEQRNVIEGNVNMIFSDAFWNILAFESIGGNAGSGHAGVNGVMDENGRIVAFGNTQDLREQVPDFDRKLQQGELFDFTIRIAMLFDAEDAKKARPRYKAFVDRNAPRLAQSNLGASIKEANKRFNERILASDDTDRSSGPIKGGTDFNSTDGASSPIDSRPSGGEAMVNQGETERAIDESDSTLLSEQQIINLHNILKDELRRLPFNIKVLRLKWLFEKNLTVPYTVHGNTISIDIGRIESAHQFREMWWKAFKEWYYASSKQKVQSILNFIDSRKLKRSLAFVEDFPIDEQDIREIQRAIEMLENSDDYKSSGVNSLKEAVDIWDTWEALVEYRNYLRKLQTLRELKNKGENESILWHATSYLLEILQSRTVIPKSIGHLRTDEFEKGIFVDRDRNNTRRFRLHPEEYFGFFKIFKPIEYKRLKSAVKGDEGYSLYTSDVDSQDDLSPLTIANNGPLGVFIGLNKKYVGNASIAENGRLENIHELPLEAIGDIVFVSQRDYSTFLEVASAQGVFIPQWVTIRIEEDGKMSVVQKGIYEPQASTPIKGGIDFNPTAGASSPVDSKSSRGKAMVTQGDIEAAIDEINTNSGETIFDDHIKRHITEKVLNMRLVRSRSVLIVGPRSSDYLPILLAKLGLKTSVIEIDSLARGNQIWLHEKLNVQNKIEPFSSYDDIPDEQRFDYIFMLGVANEIIDFLDPKEKLQRLLLNVNPSSALAQAYYKSKLEKMLEPIIRHLNPDGGYFLMNDIDSDEGLSIILSNLDEILQALGEKLGIYFTMESHMTLDNFTMDPTHLKESRKGYTYVVRKGLSQNLSSDTGVLEGRNEHRNPTSEASSPTEEERKPVNPFRERESPHEKALRQEIENNGFAIDNKFLRGSMFDPRFLQWERNNAASQKTIAVDLDFTLTSNKGTGLRKGILEQLQKLRAMGYRLVLWTTNDIYSTEIKLSKFPSEIMELFDFMITSSSWRQVKEADIRAAYSQLNEEEFNRVLSIYQKFAYKDITLLGYASIIDDVQGLFYNSKDHPLRDRLRIYPISKFEEFEPIHLLADRVDRLINSRFQFIPEIDGAALARDSKKRALIFKSFRRDMGDDFDLEEIIRRLMVSPEELSRFESNEQLDSEEEKKVVRIFSGIFLRAYVRYFLMTTNNETITGSDHFVSSPVKAKKGGVDFNPNYLNMQSQGNRVELPVLNNSQQFQNIEINGLVPFIFNITPITDIPMLLGESESSQEEFNLSKAN